MIVRVKALPTDGLEKVEDPRLDHDRDRYVLKIVGTLRLEWNERVISCVRDDEARLLWVFIGRD